MTSTGDPAFGNGELDAAFADTARRTGASIGALYLHAPDEQSLRLALRGPGRVRRASGESTDGRSGTGGRRDP
ncbi:hypothetical protein ACFQ7I_06865 [Streptomyces massasporeus]